MTLIKWSPTQVNPLNDIDTMISSVFSSDWNQKKDNIKKWMPAVDVKETDEAFFISADIPGLSKKDIHLHISNGAITISGERSHETLKDSENYHYQERESGSFSRSFDLPDSVNEEKITARFKDGMLSIELLKNDLEIPKERIIKIG